MADAIIKMPMLRSNSSSPDLSIENDIQSVLDTPPDKADTTEVYQAMNVSSVPIKLKTKTDFVTAGQRNPKYGMTFSFNIVPDLDKSPIGPVILPASTTQFVTSDSLEDIRDRIISEIDKAIKITKIAEKNPAEYDKVIRAMMRRATNEEE